MTRNNLEELLKVLEEIRENEYPHIPSEIVESIVRAQYENQDKRLEGRNQTNAIVANFLNETVTDTSEDN